MPLLRALTSSANRKAGEEFNASESEARLLCAKDGLGGQKAEFVRAELTPKQEPNNDESIAAKRRYLRRDLRAQK